MKVLPDYFEIHKMYDSLFEAAGIELCDLDWIMCEVTGKKRSQLALYGNFSSTEFNKIHRAIKERLKLNPLGYIFGRTEFFGRTFTVSNKVLIPRMDTEILIEEAIKVITEKQKTSNDVKVLDIGTGSGAIAITLQKETSANLTAVDISSDALLVATKNAKNLGADVKFIQSDLFEKVAGNKFDIIVSNPPYIESDVIDDLSPEVKDHEPHLALDGGADGLDYYRKIIKEAPKHLTYGGTILFEIGYNQASAVSELLSIDFEDIKVVKDYGNNDRVVFAKLRSNIWLRD